MEEMDSIRDTEGQAPILSKNVMKQWKQKYILRKEQRMLYFYIVRMVKMEKEMCGQESILCFRLIPRKSKIRI